MDDLPTKSPTPSVIPPDDTQRQLVVARPDTDQHLHLGIAGDTYTILLTGADTAGRYTLIDMYVPPAGGPPPHRHDFEEMFTVLEGEVELTFRGQKLIARAGETVNVPANAPHGFRNASGQPARLLCVCAPAGQDEFFMAVGTPVASRTEAPPALGPGGRSSIQGQSRSARSALPHGPEAMTGQPLRVAFGTGAKRVSTTEDRNAHTIDEFRPDHGRVGGRSGGR